MFFRSIHDTLDHILLIDRLILRYVDDGKPPQDLSLDRIYDDFDELRTARQALDAELRDRAETMTAAGASLAGARSAASDYRGEAAGATRSQTQSRAASATQPSPTAPKPCTTKPDRSRRYTPYPRRSGSSRCNHPQTAK